MGESRHRRRPPHRLSLALDRLSLGRHRGTDARTRRSERRTSVSPDADRGRLLPLLRLYALSAAGDLRRLPLLRAVLGFVAVVYLLRGTLLGGIQDLIAGDVKQVVFAAIALLIGLCYAAGALGFRTQRIDSALPELSG